MANRFRRKKTLSVLDLRGTLSVIPGIILMLIPFPWMEEVAVALDAAGFLLMSIGLFLLHEKNIGFGLADWAALGALVMTVAGYFAHMGILAELLSLGIYCFVLYFMCTSFADLANLLQDHEMAHHFKHHMVVDIVATAVEIVVHALGLHTLSYVAMAVAIYCESVLMLCMWQFYKKYHGHAVEHVS
ncbi:MAG: hypothetical protein ACOYIR_04380 [Christensenellales bacterium]|jgi:hypothetical protein